VRPYKRGAFVNTSREKLDGTTTTIQAIGA